MRKMHWLNACLLAGVAGIVSCSSDDSTTAGGPGSTGGATGGSGGNGGSGATGGSGGSSGSSVTGSGGSGGATTGGTGGTGGAAGTSATGGSAGSGTGGSAGSGTGGTAGKSDGGVADTSTPLPDTRTADTTATSDARDTGTTDSGGGGTSDAGPSPGCGLTTTQSGTLTIDVSGTMRSYVLRLPTNYNPNTPYRLIFGFHGYGGSAQGVASQNFFGVDTTANANGRAIFIAPHGVDQDGPNGVRPGWANTNGQDVALARALVDWARANLCIDSSRIFAMGFSAGGYFTNTLACQMPDVFRAVAPIAGGLGARNCVQHNIAAWITHGDMDMNVLISLGISARDYYLTRNHCTMTSTATTPSPCIAYDGCDSGYPVHWCQFSGGHMVPSFAGTGIWSFFSQF